MQFNQSTTPFGRRGVTLGQIAAQMQVGEAISRAGQPGTNMGAPVNKWGLFRTLTLVKVRLGVSDRSLSVLNALLSFHQETALTLPKYGDASPSGDEAGQGADAGEVCDLVVFPSNRALSLRAHGMAEKTLRRHLAALVAAGLILRRDSPNGKRYARHAQDDDGRLAAAFGFDLAPLVTRAGEFEALAEQVRHQQRKLRVAKERISLYRRDIAKLIACALDEGLDGPWEALRQRFMSFAQPLRRLRETSEWESLQAGLAALRAEVLQALELHVKSKNMTGNDGHNDRHMTNSNPQWPQESEPAFEKAGGNDADQAQVISGTVKQVSIGDSSETAARENTAFPLGMILSACPDVADYALSGPIRTWPAFVSAVELLRPMLGISPDAWREAVHVMGLQNAAIVVAGILQRGEHSSEAIVSEGKTPDSLVTTVNGSPAIKSAGGYLRALTQKARDDQFAIGPLLMALIGQRVKAKRGKR